MKNRILQLPLMSAMLSFHAFSADLSVLDRGRHVFVKMVGESVLCETKVADRMADAVTLRLSKSTRECGQQGATLQLSRQRVFDLSPIEHLSKDRLATKLLLTGIEVGTLLVLPLANTSGNTRWVVLGLLEVPIYFIAQAAWHLVPLRHDYLLSIACPDRQHCFP